MHRRTFAWHLIALTGAPFVRRRRAAAADLVLRGGTLVDGTGAPRTVGDLAIRAGRILAIGPRLDLVGEREIDCRDLVVAPGFVDIHTHADGTLRADPRLESFVRQGVTTAIIGADGGSRAGPGVMRALLAEIDALQPGANMGSLLGLGSVRGLVVGNADRPATSREIARMTALVEQGLAEGALGVSSGLEYTPGGFAAQAELAAVCRPLARRGLGYHTHLRNEDDALLAAVDEAIAIARGAGCALQISHLKTMGPRNWPVLDTVFARLADARAAGVDAAFDRYPYIAYQTGLTNLFPLWCRDGGPDDFLTRLEAPSTAERIRRETLAKVELIGGWHNVQLANTARADAAAEGQRLDDMAQRRGMEPYAYAVKLLRDSGVSVGMIGFAMSEANLDRILAHPWGMVASDGGAWATSGPARRGVPHPRGSGSFARVLGRHVRERGVLPLEDAIRKMTQLPASRIGLRDRGVLRVGAWADVVVFDPATIIDRATFSEPFEYAAGVKATLVNGAVAFLDGERGPRTGRALAGAGRGGAP